MLDNRDLIPVATYETLPEAQVARMLLTAAGISAVMNDEGVATLLPPVSISSGGLTLLVSEDEATRAREVLAKPDTAEGPPADPEPSADRP
jgi:hypothetical protein